MPRPNFRTPGDPEFIEALGWVLWNFLYLEDVIVRWLWLIDPEADLSDWRKEMAFEKGCALGRAVKHHEPPLPAELRKDVREWVTTYQDAVLTVRNAVAHGGGFTVSNGPDGWKPGLAYTDKDGKNTVVARSADDLFTLASAVEALMLRLYELEPQLVAALGELPAVDPAASTPELEAGPSGDEAQ